MQEWLVLVLHWTHYRSMVCVLSDLPELREWFRLCSPDRTWHFLQCNCDGPLCIYPDVWKDRNPDLGWTGVHCISAFNCCVRLPFRSGRNFRVQICSSYNFCTELPLLRPAAQLLLQPLASILSALWQSVTQPSWMLWVRHSHTPGTILNQD